MTEAEARKHLNITGAVIAIVLVMLLGALIGALVFTEVPDANQNALLIVVGIVSTNVGTVVGFYFGSSAATRAKDETIAVQAQTAKKAQEALAPLAGSAPDVKVEPGESVKVAGVEATS